MSRSDDYFKTDDKGRTILFHYAAIGDQHQVEKIIYGLPSAGLTSQRLALINHRDHDGLSAADVAAKSGHNAIASLLQAEADRINFFE
ncbi:MAG: hypothetical protein ACK2U1_06900 [Anaerolineales bacterium]|jgi:ankyrin repeat protein